MIKSLKKMRSKLSNVVNNNKGQGMTEYILLLVVVVAIVVMFKGKIVKIIEAKTESLGQSIESVQ